MGRLLVLVGAAIGGMAFWRRKSLRTDAEKVTEAAKSATARVTAGSSRKALLVELGEAVYTDRSDPDADVAADIDRLVIDLRELDAEAEATQEEATQEDVEEPAEVVPTA
jgi:hypothetical protein